MKDKIVLSGVNDLKCVGINKFVDGSNFMDIQITTLFMNLKNIENLIEEKKYAEIKQILNKMNDYDIAEIFEDLPTTEQLKIFRFSRLPYLKEFI